MNVDGVNYMTSGMLNLINSEIKLSQVLYFGVSWFLFCITE